MKEKERKRERKKEREREYCSRISSTFKLVVFTFVLLIKIFFSKIKTVTFP